MDKVTAVFYGMIALLTPLEGVLITVIFLILVNFITATYASFKLNKSFNSGHLSNTISKLFIYNLIIIAAFFLEKYIVSEAPFLKVIAGFIAITEIKSILVNYNKIYGVNPVKEFYKILSQALSNQTIKKMLEEEKEKKP